jgi:phosphoserine phosphatase RsbU/P
MPVVRRSATALDPLILRRPARQDVMPPIDTHRLQCMEVWGGNEIANNSVSMGGLDAWVEARPHQNSDAGGDVYFLSSCATGRITRILLADVSGHGASVAEIARALRTLMREHVNHMDQRKFITRMNEAFTLQSKSGIFATAIACTYFAPTRELSLVNAGHPPPMIYRAKDQSWQPLEAVESTFRGDNIPLGILDAASYEQFRVSLKEKDRVLCYTDSLIESRTNDGELLGAAGLAAVLNEMGPTDDHAFMTALTAALRAKVGETLDNDDVTMLLFTPNPATAHASFLKRAYAPIRVLGRTIAWRRDGTRRLPFPEFTLANLGGAVLPFLSRWKRR